MNNMSGMQQRGYPTNILEPAPHQSQLPQCQSLQNQSLQSQSLQSQPPMSQSQPPMSQSQSPMSQRQSLISPAPSDSPSPNY